jgi:hypothetical protein
MKTITPGGGKSSPAANNEKSSHTHTKQQHMHIIYYNKSDTPVRLEHMYKFTCSQERVGRVAIYEKCVRENRQIY